MTRPCQATVSTVEFNAALSKLHARSPFGDFDLSLVSGAEGFLQGMGLLRFTVDEEDSFFFPSHFVEVIQQLTPIGVTAEGVENLDISADFEKVAEDGDLFHAITNVSAQGVLGTVTDKENRVLRVFDVVTEMMEDSSGLTHT